MGLGSFLFGGGPSGAGDVKREMGYANDTARGITNQALAAAQGAQGRQYERIDPNDPRYQAGQNQFLGDQRQALALAQQRALGQNTVAEQQFRQAANQNVAQQAALAQSGRGNAALAQRTALNNQANVGASMAGNAAMAASQEANQYAGLAGQLAGQYGQMDAQNNQFNAQQAQALAAQNQQAQYNQAMLNDAQQRGMMGIGMQGSQQGFQNQMAYNQWLAQNKSGGLFGSLLGAGVGLGTQYLTGQIGGQAAAGTGQPGGQ